MVASKFELERLADMMIRSSIKESDKGFILSEDQILNRMSHEVFVSSGYPDPVYYRGIFGRAHNYSGLRPTNRNRYSIDAWQQDMWESFNNGG